MFSEEVIPFHISKLKGREASSRPPRVRAPSQVPVPGPVQEEHSTKKCPFHPAFRLSEESHPRSAPSVHVLGKVCMGPEAARVCLAGAGHSPCGAPCALGGALAFVSWGSHAEGVSLELHGRFQVSLLQEGEACW